MGLFDDEGFCLDDHLTDAEREMADRMSGKQWWAFFEYKRQQASDKRCLIGAAIALSLGAFILIIFHIAGISI